MLIAAALDTCALELAGASALHVNGENPELLQAQLDHAVETVRLEGGTGHTCGILITRWSPSLFTVEISADVPFGTTLEKDCWNRTPEPSTSTDPDR